MDNQNNNIPIPPGGENSSLIKLDAGSIFASDPYGLFVFKKTERLIAGIYLLSNHLSDKEPMKWSLREASNNLLFRVLSLSDRVWGEDSLVGDINTSLSEISVMLDLAVFAKMISTINYEIIQKEFDKLASFIAASAKNLSSAKIAFSPDYFSGDYDFTQNNRTNNPGHGTSWGKQAASSEFYKGQKDIKDSQDNNVFNKMSDPKKPGSEKIIKDKTNRQEIIIAMLKSGMKLTIRDFSQNIKDCSEKTIQRELLSMVTKGVLKKEGERRWSKYYLA